MRRFRVTVNGQEYEVEVEEQGGSGSQRDATPQVRIAPPAGGGAPKAKRPAPKRPVSDESKPSESAKSEAGSRAAGALNAPIPGTIIEVHVTAGQEVKAGDVLLVLEAMKMQNEITAPRDGQIKEIKVAKGASVNTGDLLLIIG